jgi:uncharacterized protein (DUF427 family)
MALIASDKTGVLMTRPVKIPDATHPITVRPAGARVTVRVGGVTVAESDSALSLTEASYPVVQYVPLADVDASVLRRTSSHTYCPYKGEASYYSVQLPDGQTETDLIWTYEQPYDAVAEIAGHLAFYPNRAEITLA